MQLIKSAVRSLIYLSRYTGPDIAYVTGKVARYSKNPTKDEWNKVINILKHLNYIRNYKITYKGKGEILAYTDSDYAGDSDYRKSISWYIVLMGMDPICWQSKKQSMVTHQSQIYCYQRMWKEDFKDQKYFHGTIQYNKTIQIYYK